METKPSGSNPLKTNKSEGAGSCVIRVFRETDLQEVKCLMHHTISTCYPEIYPNEVVQFFLNYHSEQEILRRASSGMVLVLSLCDTIRATGFLDGQEIGGVYVHPAYQRRGYGQAVVRQLLSEAVRQSKKYLHLDSTPMARPMYEKLEFRLIGPAVELIGDKSLHYFKMEKYL